MKRVRIAKEERFLIELCQQAKDQDFRLSQTVTAKEFINAFFDYIEASDNIEGKSNEKIAKKLYLDKENINVLQVGKICNEEFLDEKTVYRLRKRFVRIVYFFMQKYGLVFISGKNRPYPPV